MNTNDILIKPIISEKATKQQEKYRRYAFRVSRKANKVEIKKAVESYYQVKVEEVNTVVLPGHNKSKMTKAGYLKGKTSAYKKAWVTLKEGQNIDLYSSI